MHEGSLINEIYIGNPRHILYLYETHHSIITSFNMHRLLLIQIQYRRKAEADTVVVEGVGGLVSVGTSDFMEHMAE